MYNFKKIEKKWQNFWEENKTFKALDNSDKQKFYALVEFPYPSGAGMHVGHIKAYSGLEVIARKRRKENYNVLFPIGFDAFGLPAENYAIKTNTHPKVVTEENIQKFSDQLKKVGFAFDWDRVVNTTDPNYYKWTQWIFRKMFDNGLVFRDKTLVNYCPSCKVVLSNEDSQGGKCDICKSDIIQKEKDVWYLKITAYAEKLLEGLEEVDYLPNIKLQQQNWIGKSEGAFVDFKFNEIDETLKIYTTRPDTLYGVTFMVMAPEHPIIEKYQAKITNFAEITKYKEEISKKTEFERTQLVKDKTGVKIEGLTIINPINQESVPVYIADYVMMGYGTGAIMAVPAHDERDYDFAKKFNIPIIPVIEGGNIEKEAYTGEGKMINSGVLNGITNKKESIEKIIKYLEENNIGQKGVQYKMKDWAFNRQRYWGEPIPIVHCPKCGMVGVPYEQLPLTLPEVENFEPGTDGESPLARIEEFVNCKCPQCGEAAKRETDTMPQWAGSSWYFLRYIDPFNDNSLASEDKLNYWMNIDWYNGGMEHVTRHMIYSRFWHRFLYDIGVVNTKEPYQKRTAQGLVLGPDGDKMSKSKGNVIDPNDIIKVWGADTLRTYILFMGDYGLESPWNDNAMKGVSRFLDKVYNLKDKIKDEDNYSKDLEVIINKTIKKVSNDLENLKYNTAIAELMKLVNEYSTKDQITKKDYYVLINMLNPIAPHITEELNEMLNYKGYLFDAKWPTYDENKLTSDTYTIAVQVNGKLRDTIILNTDDSDETIKQKALESANVRKHTENKEIVKIIVIPKKIVNIVVK